MTLPPPSARRQLNNRINLPVHFDNIFTRESEWRIVTLQFQSICDLLTFLYCSFLFSFLFCCFLFSASLSGAAGIYGLFNSLTLP